MPQILYDITQSTSGVWFSKLGEIGLYLILAMGLTAYHFMREKNELRWPLSILTWGVAAILISIEFNQLLAFDRLYTAQKRGEVKTVVGEIRDFTPGREIRGLTYESFNVNGVHFSYSPYDASTPGYNQSQSRGGKLREGMKVRISHLNGRISRVEIYS